MSEVTNDSGVLTAGNTVNTLASTDRDAVAVVDSVFEGYAAPSESSPEVETVSNTELPAGGDDSDPLDDENTFDVSRAEFNELASAFLRLTDAVEKFNKSAPHKIVL